MGLRELLATKRLLTTGELYGLIDQSHSRNRRSRETLVSYHLRTGHLLAVRRGLYAVVPPGRDPQSYPVDPYLIAATSAQDGVLAYHTALEVHGKAHAHFQRFFFQSNQPLRPFSFRNSSFQCVVFPKVLRDAGQQMFATKLIDRDGLDIRVATLERTLVDVLDRPELGGGWEETWRSLESIEYFDLDLVVEYAKRLSNRTTAAKVGYYLQSHAEALMVDDRHLDPLRLLRPVQPHYLERGKPGQLVRDWNLVIPPSLSDKGGEGGL